MLNRQHHIDYIKDMLNTKNHLYYLTEPIRLSSVFWAANALRMLGDSSFQELRPGFVEFVQSCLNSDGGFGGNLEYPSTVVSTFAALQILYIFDVPYYNSRTVEFILGLQNEDGAFSNDKYGELDTRVDCCAILSLHLLSIMKELVADHAEEGSLEVDRAHFITDNLTAFDRQRLEQPIPESFLSAIGFDKARAIDHILQCYNRDGGFGQIVGAESHAAQVFCCLSSLRALGALECVDSTAIEEFLAFRQCSNGGLNGRVNKKEDVCYSFWVFAALKLIGSEAIDCEKLRSFIFSCEGENGGFSDRSGNECDLYHLMFSLASLSMMGTDSLAPVDPGFAM